MEALLTDTLVSGQLYLDNHLHEIPFDLPYKLCILHIPIDKRTFPFAAEPIAPIFPERRFFFFHKVDSFKIISLPSLVDVLTLFSSSEEFRLQNQNEIK